MRIHGLDIIKHARVAELTKKHSNLPERYIKRCLEQVLYKAPRLPNYRQVTVKKIFHLFDIHRPWTYQFQMDNLLNPYKKKRVFVEPIKHWSIFRGDRVEILTGKDKGKHGVVFEIIQERNWVFVEGLNMKLRFIGKTKSFPGMLVKKEEPLMVTTDVALVDPEDNKPCKILWRYNEEGEIVRVSERTGRIIPLSVLEAETYDYKTPQSYKENEKDTKAEDVTRITFEPSLQTFEMSIMEEHGIKEERIPDGMDLGVDSYGAVRSSNPNRHGFFLLRWEGNRTLLKKKRKLIVSYTCYKCYRQFVLWKY